MPIQLSMATKMDLRTPTTTNLMMFHAVVNAASFLLTHGMSVTPQEGHHFVKSRL